MRVNWSSTNSIPRSVSLLSPALNQLRCIISNSFPARKLPAICHICILQGGSLKGILRKGRGKCICVCVWGLGGFKGLMKRPLVFQCWGFGGPCRWLFGCLVVQRVFTLIWIRPYTNFHFFSYFLFSMYLHAFFFFFSFCIFKSFFLSFFLLIYLFIVVKIWINVYVLQKREADHQIFYVRVWIKNELHNSYKKLALE